MKQLWFLLLAANVLLMAACAGNPSSNPSANVTSNGTNAAPLSANWQFTMSAPLDNSFTGGISGGFLQQSQGSVTGSVTYSIFTPASGPNACNSGSASVTGTVQGGSVTLTVQASGQTFTLTGTLSQDNSTITGTYSTTAGTQVSGGTCGTVQTGLPFSAIAVPALNGTVQGNFHSKITNQDFPVTGELTQAQDSGGASSASVTGSLTFQGYSCLGGPSHQVINLNGGISGQLVVLQLFNDQGVGIGQVGQSAGLNQQVNPVVYESVPAGFVVHNTGGQAGFGGYYVTTKSCAFDSGNLCLAVGNANLAVVGNANANACTQPISLSPASLTFPSQLVGSASTSQTITLTNPDPTGAGVVLSGLSLSFNPGGGIAGFSDFNGFPNFLEVDSCATSPGATFSLQPQQSCIINVFFSPQQSCPWVPTAGSPAQCPPFSGSAALTGFLTVNSPKSADGNKAFSVPVSGAGQSSVVPSTPEIDFGSEAPGEASPPQVLSFTNRGMFPVQILGKASAQNACSTTTVTLTPPLQPGSADGLRVVQNNGLSEIAPGGHPALNYFCDFDASSKLPNFQLSSDSCTGTLLFPGNGCAVTITYIPQPSTPNASGLDYFLELNTLQCTGNSLQPNCEIDSGRFPVELKENPASPLRMSPGAGLDFGPQPIGPPVAGTLGNPLTITLTNDPADPHAGAVSFQGNIATGNFTETDNCGSSLASGSSCTLTITFIPSSTGFQQGAITINYTVPSQPVLASPQVQTIRLRGIGQ